MRLARAIPTKIRRTRKHHATRNLSDSCPADVQAGQLRTELRSSTTAEVVGHDRRSARGGRTGRRGGRAAPGRMPVARSTASGNFAGWAVAIVTTGSLAAAAGGRPRVPVAVCGSIEQPGVGVHPARSRRASASSLDAAARNAPVIQRCRVVGSTPAARSARKRCSCSPVRPPSPSFITHSMRSKFDDTWMSMLGLSVGTTSAIDMSPSLTNRVRMSLALDGDDEVGRSARPSGGRPSRRRRCRSCRSARTP